MIKFYLPPLVFPARWRPCHGHRPVLPAHLVRPCLVTHLSSLFTLHSGTGLVLVLLAVEALRSMLGVCSVSREVRGPEWLIFTLQLTVPQSSSWDASRSTEPVTSSGGPGYLPPPSPLPSPYPPVGRLHCHIAYTSQ